METLDKVWFQEQLHLRGKSLRGLAKHLEIDPSAASRMLSGARKMKMPEAEKIARFLSVPVDEILRRAGIDLEAAATKSLMLEATISDQGRLVEIEPRALPSPLLVRAQASLGLEQRGKVVAAQVRAMKGPLALWDDAVVLYAETSTIEPAAVGVLSIAKLRDGVTLIGHLDKARKTGEATVRMADGELREVVLATAAPVLAVLP